MTKNMEMVKKRYEGIQTALLNIGMSGCHFLTLCTIAEEFNGKKIDLIDLIRVCQSKKWIKADFWVSNDGTPILEYLTGKKWTRKEVENLPEIKDNDYTEPIWYNPRTSFEHFRRRYIDTLEYSVTVQEGYVRRYYIYTVEVA